MNTRFHFSGFRLQQFSFAAVVVSTSYLYALPDKLVTLCRDRAAIERVYYNHRLGTKPPFEQALPPAQIEKMVKLDLKKEAVLKSVYKIDINQSDVEEEVSRIETTTRAPETLAELKQALANNGKRFADTVARPIVAERKLREKFQNDVAIHAQQRKQAEQIRQTLLALKESNERADVLKKEKNGNANEVTWQFGPRPHAEKTAASAPVANPDNQPSTVSSANYSIEATAQLSQVMAAPEVPATEREKSYFGDLEPELQKVLRAQLNKAGAVSAVIEAPSAFLLFVAREHTDGALRAASLTIPKRSYDEWLAQQSD